MIYDPYFMFMTTNPILSNEAGFRILSTVNIKTVPALILLKDICLINILFVLVVAEHVLALL